MAIEKLSIDNRIREYRGIVALTQQELATRVGVSRQTINAIETGKYAPSLEVAFRIARAVGMSLEQVFVCTPARRGGRGE